MWQKAISGVAVVLVLSLAPLVTAGQMGWWALDEGSGTTARDGSGKGHDGTLMNGATWADGKFGKAVKLNGDAGGAYVQIPHDPGLCVDKEVTVSVWVNPERTDGPNASGYSGIVAKGNAPRSYSLYVRANGTLHFSTGPGGAYIGTTSVAAIPINEWTHLAVKVEGGVHKYYLNGTLDATGGADVVLPGTADTGPLYLGRTAESNRELQGMIDEVHLYDFALTDEQIMDLYNNKPPVFPKAVQPDPADGTIGAATPLFQWIRGDGALFHDIYIGTTPDLTEADKVGSHQPFAMYYHVAGLQPGTTYYWRIDEIAADGTVTTGDVWSFVTQDVKAYHPTPADQANAMSLAPTLTWMAGVAATEHHVYFGDSNEAVSQGAAEVDKGTQAETSFAPGALEPATTYFWRVDETVVGGAVNAGAVWTFATPLPVDDFESYTDDEGSRIYETWIDGWTNGTGSTVGYVQAPFAEQAIVHSGNQSMPLDYNNVKAPFYSEAEREFSPAQDWTVNSLDTLSLFVRGEAGNGAGKLYLAIEDSAGKSAVVINPDPAAVNAGVWTEWKIPLSSLTGVNLSKVKRLYLGVGDRDAPVAGGSGRLYIDDIRVTIPVAAQ
jgi:hypothetical protein